MSCLRENLTSSSYGEGLETGRATIQVPRQPFTRHGYSRSIVQWDLRESMKEAEIEIILERAREKYPDARPRIISDNGPQFIARDFKEFIRIAGMTHVRTSPGYPQSNGKLERWHKSLKSECIRPGTPLTREDAERLIQAYVDHYNTVRLHRLEVITRCVASRKRPGDLKFAHIRSIDLAKRGILRGVRSASGVIPRSVVLA